VSRSVQVLRRAVQHHRHVQVPVREMASSAQPTAAVPAVPGEDDDRLGTDIADVSGEVPAGVLHHLQ